MRGPTGLKFCKMVSTRPIFIMPVQNFWGRTPKKFSGAKNMQNLTKFRTISKFGGEYLRKVWRYSNSDSHSVYGDSSCVTQKKSGEVWSSDLGDLDVESYPPKVHFSVPNFGRHTPKKFQGRKTWKIWPDFGRLWSSAANTSETDEDIQNQIVITVNFGPVTLEI